MFFAARYAKSEYHLRQPSRIWVPVPLRADLSIADQKKLAAQIEEKIRTEEILRAVVVDVGLQAKFKQPSEDTAVKELNRRLFVEVGTADTPKGAVPSINIGVSGIGRETGIRGEASMRIFKDVQRIIGIDPETRKPMNPRDSPPSDEF